MPQVRPSSPEIDEYLPVAIDGNRRQEQLGRFRPAQIFQSICINSVVGIAACAAMCASALHGLGLPIKLESIPTIANAKWIRHQNLIRLQDVWFIFPLSWHGSMRPCLEVTTNIQVLWSMGMGQG